MKKLFLAIFIIISSIVLYSQPRERDSISIIREQYMYGQRMLGSHYIPPHGLPDAIKHRDSLRIVQGFYGYRHHSGQDQSVPAWSSLGPTPGHYDGYAISGRCSFVKYDQDNTNIIYVGGACGGLWKSVDNGNSFMPLTDNLNSLSQWCPRHR